MLGDVCPQYTLGSLAKNLPDMYICLQQQWHLRLELFEIEALLNYDILAWQCVAKFVSKSMWALSTSSYIPVDQCLQD